MQSVSCPIFAFVLAAGPLLPGCQTGERTATPGDSQPADTPSETGTGADHPVAHVKPDEELARLNRIAAQARVEQVKKSGKGYGFRLTAIEPNSVYTRSGLKDGDIVTSVNGYALDTPNRVLELYTRLKNEAAVKLGVERDGKLQILDIAVHH